ncbi:MAG: orotate phosphoribosyltransferase [Firmicutes bacterium]|nr:orotate phosphoribosyltransferase [Bacillota bacterium]
MAKIIDLLFATGAIRVSPADQPFWYTSGLIGPYYVNTHFLIGSEQVANNLLALIDESRHNPPACTGAVLQFLRQQYKESEIFKQVIDTLVQVIQGNYNMDDIDYISGGERRDWFFSLLPAELLGKPHLTIFKDQQVVVVSGENIMPCTNLAGARVLHISDLITEASSYLRAWIPALSSREATMVGTITVVDRCQGGAAALAQAQVPMTALVQINADLFKMAAARGYITQEQLQLITDYLADPYHSMRQFLIDNPSFLQQALNGDKRTAERARRLLDEDLYNLSQQG